MAQSPTEREIAKANHCATAWMARFARVPTKHAILAVLAVAELETGAGDYRIPATGEPSHNWGQIQRRQLTEAEHATIKAGARPSPRDDSEFLNGDTSPTSGAYLVWLWRFADDIAGADKLLYELVVSRSQIGIQIDSISMEELARLMYATRYFEGSHDPRQPGGKEANIADYAASLTRHATTIAVALADWSPLMAPSPPVPSAAAMAPPSGSVALGALLPVPTSIASSTPALVRASTSAATPATSPSALVDPRTATTPIPPASLLAPIPQLAALPTLPGVLATDGASSSSSSTSVSRLAAFGVGAALLIVSAVLLALRHFVGCGP